MAQQEFDLRRILPTGIVIVAIIFVVVFWSRMTITIDAGHAGILFKTFGGGIDTDKTYGEGFHFIAPWNEMIVYETRQQEIAEDMNVLSSNGLEIKADISAWYRPEYDKLGLLHANIGKDYLRRVVIPALRSLSAHTGLIGNKFAASVSAVRKVGTGVIDKTWTDAWAYYIGMSSIFSK